MSNFFDKNVEVICEYGAKLDKELEIALLMLYPTDEKLMQMEDVPDYSLYKKLAIQRVLNTVDPLFEKMRGSWSDKAGSIINAAANGLVDLDIADELLTKIEFKVCKDEQHEKIKQRVTDLEEKIKLLFTKF